MSEYVKIGTILHHQNFKFSDGTTRNKYLVVLGAKLGHNYLCALVTSKIGIKKAETGCHHTPYTYFFIPADRKFFFPKDTWILLNDLIIMTDLEVRDKQRKSIIQIRAILKQNIAGEIRNCLKGSWDISEREMKLL